MRNIERKNKNRHQEPVLKIRKEIQMERIELKNEHTRRTKQTNMHQQLISFFPACFTSDHDNFVHYIHGKTFHGCINHDIVVVSLCCDLLMRLSYYIHLVFGNKLFAHMDCELSSLLLCHDLVNWPQHKHCTLALINSLIYLSHPKTNHATQLHH